MTREGASFSLVSRELSGHPGFSLEALHGSERLGRLAFYEALRDEAELRTALTAAMLAANIPALAWETAPLSRAGSHRPMEQLLLPHPALARAEADPQPFAEHIAGGAGTAGVGGFGTFGADARLLVPCAPKPGVRFAHLVTFLASAHPSQRDALWQLVGRLACEHVARSEAPLWVSTAGMAVSWVHVRLDLRPKYYRTDALRSPDA